MDLLASRKSSFVSEMRLPFCGLKHPFHLYLGFRSGIKLLLSRKLHEIGIFLISQEELTGRSDGIVGVVVFYGIVAGAMESWVL